MGQRVWQNVAHHPDLGDVHVHVRSLALLDRGIVAGSCLQLGETMGSGHKKVFLQILGVLHLDLVSWLMTDAAAAEGVDALKIASACTFELEPRHDGRAR